MSHALDRATQPRSQPGARARSPPASPPAGPGPCSGSTARAGRSTRTRRSAGLRPCRGRRPPIMGCVRDDLVRAPVRVRYPGLCSLATIGHVRDDRVLAAHERGLEPLGRLVVEQPVPPVAGDVLGQDDDRDRGLLVRRPGVVEHVEVGDDRVDERAVRRLDDDQRDARQLALPALAQRLGLLEVVGHVHRLEHRASVARDRPNITAWTTARLMPLTGMITRCSRCGPLEHEVVADLELVRLAVVLAPDEQHHADEDRDEHQHEPRPVEELHRRHDDRDRRRSAPHPTALIDRRRRQPGVLRPEPVPDHAALGDREVDEHAHRVQRDQRVGRSAAERSPRRRRPTPSRMIPVENARRSPRNANWRGHEAVLGEDGAAAAGTR